MMIPSGFERSSGFNYRALAAMWLALFAAVGCVGGGGSGGGTAPAAVDASGSSTSRCGAMTVVEDSAKRCKLTWTCPAGTHELDCEHDTKRDECRCRIDGKKTKANVDLPAGQSCDAALAKTACGWSL